MEVQSESEVAQSCPTLHNPLDCSLPGSSVHGIFQARVLERGAIACSTEIDITLQINSPSIKLKKKKKRKKERNARWPSYKGDLSEEPGKGKPTLQGFN